MRLGTRRSALALAQAHWVAERLRAVGGLGDEGVEIVELTTAGDRGERLSDKSRWVSELERALLDDRIDLAVHSAKDVPGELAEGTVLAAVPEREDPSDVLCGAASLSELPAGARVGTSSLRRAAQLRALRGDLQVIELRGNVDTRLRKLADGEADAIVLAAAGLRRLGRQAEIGGVLPGLVPAAGQGALGLQARAGDRLTLVAAAALSDPDAFARVRAERAVTGALGASCHTAVGAFARRVGDGDSGALGGAASGGRLELQVWVGLPDGSEWIADTLVAAEDEVGALVAERLIAVGARELLARAEGLVP